MRIKSMIILCAFLASAYFFSHDAYAATLTWSGFGNVTSTIGLSLWSGAPLPGGSTPPTKFEVTDSSLANNGQTDHINVQVNSTSDPTGITLTLTETGDTGHFFNTNLVFTNSTSHFTISSKQTVGITGYGLNTDSNLVEQVISGPDNVMSGIQVVSSSDTNGIYMNLTETGPDTGIFTNELRFTTGTSVNGSAISVQPGEIVTIVDVYTEFNGAANFDDASIELVEPNSNPALGALYAKYLDTVDVVYGSDILSATISNTSDPGGGGGGLIRPSLVIDAIIGGSPYVVSPPSFGGRYYHYSDGLTLTQGNEKSIFDTSKYNQEIPKQVMVKDQQVNMTFKTFESYNSEGVIGMTLYLIPRGQDLNMDVSKNIASIEWKKGKPVDVDDPNHILTNAKALSISDGKFQHTQFSFVPTKSYDRMSFLARAWNDHRYVTEMRVHDDVNTPPPIKTLPAGVIKYNSFDDLMTVLEKDQFYKPQIMSHIHNTNSVFQNSEGGNIYWLYDTINHTVTLVIADKDDNNLFSYKSSLEPYAVEKKGDYKFIYFTVKQLNRWNQEQEQKTMDIEEEKAMSLAQEKGIMPNRNWQYYIS